MACPTCSATLENIGLASERAFHCGRCGTIVVERAGDWKDIYVPVLAERCRKYEAAFSAEPCPQVDLWRLLGIQEAIRVPGERTKAVRP